MPHPAIPGPLLPTQPDTMQPHKLRKLWAGITMHTQPRQHPGSRIPALRLVPGIPLTRPQIPPSSIGCCKRRPRHQPQRLSRPSLPQPSRGPRISRARIIVSRNRQSAQLPLQHRIQQLPHRQIILALSLHLSRGRQLLGHQQRGALRLGFRQAHPLEHAALHRHLSRPLHPRAIRQRPLRHPERTLSILVQSPPRKRIQHLSSYLLS